MLVGDLNLGRCSTKLLHSWCVHHKTKPQESTPAEAYIMLWHVENDVKITGKYTKYTVRNENIDCDLLECRGQLESSPLSSKDDPKHPR